MRERRNHGHVSHLAAGRHSNLFEVKKPPRVKNRGGLKIVPVAVGLLEFEGCGEQGGTGFRHIVVRL